MQTLKKLNFQWPSESWKLFSSRFITAVMQRMRLVPSYLSSYSTVFAFTILVLTVQVNTHILDNGNCLFRNTTTSMNNCGKKNEIKKRKEIKRKEIEYIIRVYNAAMDDFVIIIIITVVVIIIIIIIIIVMSYVFSLIMYFCFRTSQHWVITNGLRY